MCQHRIKLRGCKHPRVAASHKSCPRSCRKPGANVTQEGKCTKCAGRKRGSLARKAGGVNGLTNKMSGMHVSEGGKKLPKPRKSFVDAVRKQKQLYRTRAAAAAARAPALAPVAVAQQPGNTTNAQTMPHVRVVKRNG